MSGPWHPDGRLQLLVSVGDWRFVRRPGMLGTWSETVRPAWGAMLPTTPAGSSRVAGTTQTSETVTEQ